MISYAYDTISHAVYVFQCVLAPLRYARPGGEPNTWYIYTVEGIPS